MQAGAGGDLGGGGSIPATAQFPVDLQRMLNTVEQLGMDDIVGWQNNGASFVVHKKDEFENQVMPRFFPRLKYVSFKRRLHLFGFRSDSKQDKRAFRHPGFARWKSAQELLDNIKASERKPKASKSPAHTRTGSLPAKSGSNSSSGSQRKPPPPLPSISTKAEYMLSHEQEGVGIHGDDMGGSSSQDQLRQLLVAEPLQLAQLQDMPQAQDPIQTPSAVTSEPSFKDPASFQSPLLPSFPAFKKRSPLAVASQTSIFPDQESLTEQLESRHMQPIQEMMEQQRHQRPLSLMSSNPGLSEHQGLQLQQQQLALPGLVGQQSEQYRPQQLQQLHPYNLQVSNTGIDTNFDSRQQNSPSSEKCDFSPSLPPDNWNLLEPTPFAPGDDGTRRRPASSEAGTRRGSSNTNETKSPDETRNRGKHRRRSHHP